MKKQLLIAAFSLSMYGAYAQGSKVVSAWNLLNAFKNGEGYENIEKARTYIDEATLDAKTGIQAKTWYYRGMIAQAAYEKPKEGTAKDLEQLKTAFDSYKKAQELDPKYSKDEIMTAYAQTSVSFFNYAIDKYNTKGFAEAFQAFNKAKEVNDLLGKEGQKQYIKSEECEKNAAICAQNGNLYDEAIALYNKELEKTPSAALYRRIANLYDKKGDKAKYKETIAAGLTAYPDDVDLLIEDLNNSLKDGKELEAVDKFKKATALSPNNAQLHFALGTVYDKLGKMDDAKASYEKALALNPEDFKTNFNIGASYFKRANMIIEQMNNITGNTPADLKKYEALKVEKNKYLEIAKPYFDKADKIQPNDADVQRALNKIKASLAN